MRKITSGNGFHLPAQETREGYFQAGTIRRDPSDFFGAYSVYRRILERPESTLSCTVTTDFSKG